MERCRECGSTRMLVEPPQSSAAARVDRPHEVPRERPQLRLHCLSYPPRGDATKGVLVILTEDGPEIRDVLLQFLDVHGCDIHEYDRRELQGIGPESHRNMASPNNKFFGMTLAEIERLAIQETLQACGGNRSRSARCLGVSEKTIYNKMKSYRILDNC